MNKFILFSDTGTLLARYIRGTHSEGLISLAIEVTDEVFEATTNQKDGIWVLENGAVVKKPFPEPTLSELKTAKKTELSRNFEQTIQQITAGYPPNEIASWSKQEQEARAFTAVPLSATPLIDALAVASGVPKAALAARIIVKADLFAGISGQIIGKRQGLVTAIEATTSKAALTAIVW